MQLEHRTLHRRVHQDHSIGTPIDGDRSRDDVPTDDDHEVQLNGECVGRKETERDEERSHKMQTGPCKTCSLYARNAPSLVTRS